MHAHPLITTDLVTRAPADEIHLSSTETERKVALNAEICLNWWGVRKCEIQKNSMRKKRRKNGESRNLEKREQDGGNEGRGKMSPLLINNV